MPWAGSHSLLQGVAMHAEARLSGKSCLKVGGRLEGPSHSVRGGPLPTGADPACCLCWHTPGLSHFLTCRVSDYAVFVVVLDKHGLISISFVSSCISRMRYSGVHAVFVTVSCRWFGVEWGWLWSRLAPSAGSAGEDGLWCARSPLRCAPPSSRWNSGTLPL